MQKRVERIAGVTTISGERRWDLSHRRGTQRTRSKRVEGMNDLACRDLFSLLYLVLSGTSI